MLYMVCDGHSGSEAANYVAANFVRILNSFLPSKAPNMANTKGTSSAYFQPFTLAAYQNSVAEMEAFAEVIRQAVVETFVRLDNDWIAVGHMSGACLQHPSSHPYRPGTSYSSCLPVSNSLIRS